ncbi:helix-turn-helix transcriptional regulator [Mesorhizobium abyssinicae]|uniref:Helix-turn-helix transcriptional regulator n=1 Tax=Mesorhizobium abyssinicae TaxID=1209958 RepID=A0ABU5AII3_9HYPH|nr:helix-turn-helix transcriptional regulator [Mesorhizobium abyssinicae]MDX8537087.1 helix-turn-helix transcriptional regulator [Mesorhizobium abyssinicae]
MQTTMERPAIDKQWFIDKLAETGKSVRGLARHLGVDASAVSRMLSGNRKMKMTEAGDIASFLGVPVSEVLVHSGVSVSLEPRPSEMLLAATIDERGIVDELPEPKPLPPAVIERARATITIHGDEPIVGAQIRALKGPLSVMDDAVVLYRYQGDGIDPAAIGLLSICRSRDGEQFLGKIERARKTGEARVTCANGDVRDVALDAATPVLAVIP